MQLKEGINGRDILFTSNESSGKKRHQWMECSPCKQQIMWLKGSTLGWDILLTNDESRGEIDTYVPIDGVVYS